MASGAYTHTQDTNILTSCTKVISRNQSREEIVKQAMMVSMSNRNTVILEKFTSQNFQFKIIQPKKFWSLKVINKKFYG